MTTVYPSGYDTLTSLSLGTTKANAEDVVDPVEDIDAAEWNTVAGAVRALETKVGDGSALLTRFGDPDLANIRETMDFMATRADRAGFMEHFLFNAWSTAWVDDVGAVGVYAQVAGGVGVGDIITAAGVATGFAQAYDHFHQRSSYFRIRPQLLTLPATNLDTIEIGLRRDATHRVVFLSTRGPGAWGEFYARVEDGAGMSQGIMATTPVLATWYTMEILTTATASTFFINRGTVTEDYRVITAQAPEDGYAHPSILVTSNAGGQHLYCDLIACRDTRPL